MIALCRHRKLFSQKYFDSFGHNETNLFLLEASSKLEIFYHQPMIRALHWGFLRKMLITTQVNRLHENISYNRSLLWILLLFVNIWHLLPAFQHEFFRPSLGSGRDLKLFFEDEDAKIITINLSPERSCWQGSYWGQRWSSSTPVHLQCPQKLHLVVFHGGSLFIRILTLI